MYVRENKRYVKVNYKEILYFEGLGEYVQIFSENDYFSFALFLLLGNRFQSLTFEEKIKTRA